MILYVGIKKAVLELQALTQLDNHIKPKKIPK